MDAILSKLPNKPDEKRGGVVILDTRNGFTNVELAVMEGLRDGHIHFPAPEAHVLVPLKDEEQADTTTPANDNIPTAEAA